MAPGILNRHPFGVGTNKKASQLMPKQAQASLSIFHSPIPKSSLFFQLSAKRYKIKIWGAFRKM